MITRTVPGCLHAQLPVPQAALEQRRCSLLHRGLQASHFGRQPCWPLRIEPDRHFRSQGLTATRAAKQAGVASNPADRPPISRTEQQSPTEVADKLIAVFRQRRPDEWRKLIAFSKQWPKLAPVVLDRLDARGKLHEDPGEKLQLRQLRRRLAQVQEELQGYDALVHRFQAAPPEDWESLVTAHHDTMRSEFFGHLNCRVQALHEDEDAQAALSRLAVQLATLVDAVDKIAGDEAQMDTAAAQFDDLLQSDTLEDADRRIDDLAASGQLSPALLLTMAKAYAGANDSNMTKEEVKDIMAHLYFKAKERFASEQPPEVRILKHLLTFDDPVELRSALNAAFTPSDTPNVVSAGPEDLLSTKPVLLEATIDAVLQAYDAQAGRAGMGGEAAALMTPEVIERMRRLLAMLRKEFL